MQTSSTLNIFMEFLKKSNYSVQNAVKYKIQKFGSRAFFKDLIA